MKPTVIQPSITAQGHSSCVTRRQRRNRRWAASAASCTSVLRAAIFTLETDGSVNVEYSSYSPGKRLPEKVTVHVERSGVELWWTPKLTGDRPSVLTQNYTEGSSLQACPVRVRGVTIDILNAAVEGFKLYDKSELEEKVEAATLESLARAICSRSSGSNASENFVVVLPVDKVLDSQALKLLGVLWEVNNEIPAVEFTAWTVGSPEQLKKAATIPANSPLFKRVAAEMWQKHCSFNGVSSFQRPKPAVDDESISLAEFQKWLDGESCVPNHGGGESCVPGHGNGESCVPSHGDGESCVPNHGDRTRKWTDHQLADAWLFDGLARVSPHTARSWFAKNAAKEDSSSELPDRLAVIAASRLPFQTVKLLPDEIAKSPETKILFCPEFYVHQFEVETPLKSHQDRRRVGLFRQAWRFILGKSISGKSNYDFGLRCLGTVGWKITNNSTSPRL